MGSHFSLGKANFNRGFAKQWRATTQILLPKQNRLTSPLRFREDFPFDAANKPVGIQTRLGGYRTPLALTAVADRLFAEEGIQGGYS
jgi:hypothetical protein